MNTDIPEFKKSVEWFHNYDYYMALADKYNTAYRSNIFDDQYNEIFEEYREYYSVKVIFESNLVESAGLSEGDTRKIIFHETDNTEQSDNVIAAFAGKEREAIEVLQHYKTYAQCFKIIGTYLKGIAHKDTTKSILSQKTIKQLHKMLMQNLIKEKNETAGQYRKCIVGIDDNFERIFPSASLIKPCMNIFIKKSNKIINLYFRKRFNNWEAKEIITIAAQISYDFVDIHPFIDGNGRVSRIILNIILHLFRLPFFVAIKGNKRDKKRYFRALKFANNGNIKPYAALIAKYAVEQFEEIDKNLHKAGMLGIIEYYEKHTKD